MISLHPTLPDYLTIVARGWISGATPFSAYGEKTTTGADSGVLWPNGAFTFPSSAGVQMSIVSSSASDDSAGTGIRTLDIHYLDADLAEQVETITMDGTTPVTTVATNIRFIQCVHMLTWGSNNSAVGNITISNAGNTHSFVAAGDVRCTSSVRMVPAGKRLMVTSFFGGSSSGAGAASTIVRIATPNFDGHNFISANVFVPLASAPYQDISAGISISCPVSFTEGQVFGMIYETDKAATVCGSWFGWIENA